MLNIQSLVVRSSLHSSSSSKCVEGKAYDEKIQFAQIIIHDIDMTKTFAIEFCIEAKDIGAQENKHD